MEKNIKTNGNPGPGRPSLRIEVNFNNPQKSLDQIRLLCKNKNIKENTLLFAKALLGLTEHVVHEQSSQTDSDVADICNDFLEHAPNEELLYMTSSKEGDKNAYELNLDDLKADSKSEFYGKCDKRLKSFIDKLTDRAVYKTENYNFKSNIYENMLKARNSKFTSKTGLKEHMVVYLASGKSMHSSQVFSKQGGKGTRPILEKILTNSADVCKFSAPDKAFLFYSYDNIQTLLKSYRIGGNHPKKVLAIVVCSILRLMFMSEDGKHSELQFKHENSPANWYMEYTYGEKGPGRSFHYEIAGAFLFSIPL